MIHVGKHRYSVYTTAKALNKWCFRLCASIGNKKAATLLAPSWDSKAEKLSFTFLLPRLAHHVLSEWSTMYVNFKLPCIPSQWRPSLGPPPPSPR